MESRDNIEDLIEDDNRLDHSLNNEDLNEANKNISNNYIQKEDLKKK